MHHVSAKTFQKDHQLVVANNTVWLSRAVAHYDSLLLGSGAAVSCVLHPSNEDAKPPKVVLGSTRIRWDPCHVIWPPCLLLLRIAAAVRQHTAANS